MVIGVCTYAGEGMVCEDDGMVCKGDVMSEMVMGKCQGRCVKGIG